LSCLSACLMHNINDFNNGRTEKCVNARTIQTNNQVRMRKMYFEIVNEPFLSMPFKIQNVDSL